MLWQAYAYSASLRQPLKYVQMGTQQCKRLHNMEGTLTLSPVPIEPVYMFLAATLDCGNFQNAGGWRCNSSSSNGQEMVQKPYALWCHRTAPLPSNCASSMMTPGISSCNSWKWASQLIPGMAIASQTQRSMPGSQIAQIQQAEN